MKSRVLVVEDDSSLADSITHFLTGEGYQVRVISNLSDAREATSAFAPDLILMDWMLPDGQGIDFLRRYRASGGAVPVILLTAKADLVDKVLGLEIGANDYVTKPFEPRELSARIRVQLRARGGSSGNAEPACLNVGPFFIDLASRSASVQGERVELTRMEFELLRLFCENPNRVFSREELLNKVWGYQSFPTTRTVDTHILQLRNKLGETFFETVRGIGYRLKI
jgi:DNA-binding response OmpR family regulator